MRNLKFKFVRATNILCFGDDGIEFHFDDYANVVQIKGLNLDNPGSTDEDRSNGSGKSSIPEILSIALFGRTVKYPTKMRPKNIINALADSAEVEVIWDDYRVVRSYKKGKTGNITTKLKIWESADHLWDKDSDQTKGTMSESQKWVEERVGLTHRAFCSVVIFEDSDRNSFLEMDASEKREFVENLLGIDVFRMYHDVVKKSLKEKKKLAQTLAVTYEQLSIALDQCKARLQKTIETEATWGETKKKEILLLKGKIEERQKQLQNSDIGQKIAEWQASQDEVVTHQKTIEDNQSKKSRFQSAIQTGREKAEDLRVNISAIREKVQKINAEIIGCESEISAKSKIVTSLSGLEDGNTCDKCLSVINPANYGHVLSESRGEIDSLKAKIEVKRKKLGEAKDVFDKETATLKKFEKTIGEADSKLSLLDSSIQASSRKIAELSKMVKPDGSVEEQIWENEIVSIKQSVSEKEKELEHSPYQEIIVQTKQEEVDRIAEIEIKASELKEVESEIPYYEFWYKAFGDDGIRKYIIEGIIPALNSRINYWMEYLIDGKIKLEFDNGFNTTITRSGNLVEYHGMSKSERRKINLSISQAFSFVMMINSGNRPSLVFLDEITGGSIDRAGVVGIHKMIFELAKERQVFVTTHNENLLTMLDGCQTINLVKENDISRIID